MKARPSIDTALIRRRNSFVQKRNFKFKAVINTQDLDKEPVSGLEIKTPDSRLESTTSQITRKNSRSMTGNVSPSSAMLALAEDDRRTGEHLPECRKFVFQFREESGSPLSQAETPSHRFSDVSGSLISAKESLYDLRHEAKLYLSSNKRIISDAQRSRRASFVSEDPRGSFYQSELFQDPLRDLSDSISDLKTRFIENEKKKEQHLNNEGSLKDAIHSLSKNLEKFHSLKLENESKSVGCASNCHLF